MDVKESSNKKLLSVISICVLVEKYELNIKEGHTKIIAKWLISFQTLNSWLWKDIINMTTSIP